METSEMGVPAMSKQENMTTPQRTPLPRSSRQSDGPTDYLGRTISDGVDQLGRETDGETDYLGRAING